MHTIDCLLLWTIVFIICGCHENTQSVFFVEESISHIDSIAHNKNFYGLLLTDTSQCDFNKCKSYLSSLGIKNEKTFFDIIDINSPVNKWFVELIFPDFVPILCCFDKKGKIIDIIPGMTRESSNYSSECFNEGIQTAFPYRNVFHLNKKELITKFNTILEYKNRITKEEKSLDSESIINVLDYPYTHHLLLEKAIKEKDFLSLHEISKNLLAHESSFTIPLYKEVFVKAKQALNPSYNYEDRAKISTSKDTIYILNAEKGKDSLFDIYIKNKGNDTLKIEKIKTSCSCLSLAQNHTATQILPHDSINIKIVFSPDVIGKIYREIYFYSNDYDKPLFFVSLYSDVKK